MNKDQIELFLSVIRDTGNTPYSYSGRGMYGVRCVAVDVDDVPSFMFNMGLLLGTDGTHDIDNFVCLGIRTDSMGMGSVVYFPEIRWENRYNEDGEGEDDGDGDGDGDGDEGGGEDDEEE